MFSVQFSLPRGRLGPYGRLTCCPGAAPRPGFGCSRSAIPLRAAQSNDRRPACYYWHLSCARISEKGSLHMISVADVDSLLAQKVNEHHYARVSIRGYASSLRAFFRYAEMRGWCGGGIAASIMSRGAGAPSTAPLVTSKTAPCHGHVNSAPTTIPSERGPPRWVQVSSIA